MIDERLLNKQFTYRSKYGGITKGIIKSFLIVNRVQQTTFDTTLSGFKIQILCKSENGIAYDLNEITVNL